MSPIWKMTIALIVLLQALPFHANGQVVTACAETPLLSGTDTSGLSKRIIDIEERVSSEGATYVVYFRGAQPELVVSEQFGEVGRATYSVRLINGSFKNYAALVYWYDYSSPVYMEDSRVISIQTDSFIVCNGARISGVAADDGRKIESTRLVNDILAIVSSEMGKRAR